jgi:hypothetical protein
MTEKTPKNPNWRNERRASQLRTPEEKKQRALTVLQKLIGEGKNKKEIAKEMKISAETVERSMRWAGEANVFVEYEQRIFKDLIPLAHEALKMALEDGDAQVALKIYEGVRLLKKNEPKGQAAMDNDEGLYGEIARIRAGQVINVTPALASTGEVYGIPRSFPTGEFHWDTQDEAGEGEVSPEDSPPGVAEAASGGSSDGQLMLPGLEE